MISAYLHLVYSTGFSSAMLWLVCWIWILRGSAANKTGKGKEGHIKQLGKLQFLKAWLVHFFYITDNVTLRKQYQKYSQYITL